MKKKCSSILILLIFLFTNIYIIYKTPPFGELEIGDNNIWNETEETPVIKQKENKEENPVILEESSQTVDASEIMERETAYKAEYEAGNRREISDYLFMTRDEFMDTVGKECNMICEGSIVTGDGGVSFTFDEKGMTQASIEISFFENADRPGHAWTLCDIALFHDRSELEDGLLSEERVSWLQAGGYAYAGLELQKRGFEYLYICGDDEIIKVAAKINPDYVEQLKNYTYEWEEENFLYENKSHNVVVKISYPFLNIPGFEDISKRVNQNIQESAFMRLSGVQTLEELENYQLCVDYRIESDAGDYISIRFDGIQSSNGKESVFATGSTSSILDGGKKIRLDEVLGEKADLVMVETKILESNSYTVKEKEKRISELFPNYTDYVVTPFFVHYFGEPNDTSSDICTVTKYVRDKDYRE